MALQFSNFQDRQYASDIGSQPGAIPTSGGYSFNESALPPPVATTTGSFSQQPFSSAPPNPTSAPMTGPTWETQKSAPTAQPRGSSFTPTTTTSAWEASKPLPTYEAGKFEAPEYNDREVLKGQQRFAAPSIRRLREQVQVAQAQTYENPNVKAMTVREALQGYGSGLETTMAGAYRQAAADYDRKFKVDWDERMTNFRAAEVAKGKSFQAALDEWGKTGTTTSSRTADAGGSTTSNGVTTSTGGKIGAIGSNPLPSGYIKRGIGHSF